MQNMWIRPTLWISLYNHITWAYKLIIFRAVERPQAIHVAYRLQLSDIYTSPPVEALRNLYCIVLRSAVREEWRNSLWRQVCVQLYRSCFFAVCYFTQSFLLNQSCGNLSYNCVYSAVGCQLYLVYLSHFSQIKTVWDVIVRSQLMK